MIGSVNNFSDLIEAILALDNFTEAEAFLKDLLTEQEIVELAKRYEAASMLSSGSSYVEIEKATGLSSTTIARVSKALNSQTGGYRTVLSRKAKK